MASWLTSDVFALGWPKGVLVKSRETGDLPSALEHMGFHAYDSSPFIASDQKARSFRMRKETGGTLNSVLRPKDSMRMSSMSDMTSRDCSTTDFALKRATKTLELHPGNFSTRQSYLPTLRSLSTATRRTKPSSDESPPCCATSAPEVRRLMVPLAVAHRSTFIDFVSSAWRRSCRAAQKRD